MKIQILNNAKKKKIVAELAGLGVKKISELLIRTGKERIRAYSGDLSTEQIMEIWRMMPIEGVGLYVGKERISRNGVREVRLSVDGMHVWKEQLTKRVFVLSEEQEGEWFLGKDIELGGGGWNASLVGGSKMTPGFVSVKSGDDFVGMGKIGVDGDMLYNFLPKERRRRN